MAKLDFTRDYYADLELPASADVNEIKKQFRRLALKYHPDRNPGREDQVQAKFQIIQAAHEILTNADQKAQYDARRRAGGSGSSSHHYSASGAASGSSYPSASGVRGNPWADVSGRFPKPPRRAGQAPTSARPPPSSSSSGASSSTRPPPPRPSAYAGFGPPPPPKAGKDDLNSRYTAWKNMRPGGAGASSSTNSRPASSAGPSASAAYAAAAGTKKKAPPPGGGMPPPPTPPRAEPRTASQRQKADASFGAARRPTGFYPQSPMVGDEPPAASTTYYTSRRVPEVPPRRSSPEVMNSAAADGGMDGANDAWADATPLDTRQSMPYQTHGGERFNPLDGAAPEVAAHLQRAKSTRAAAAAAAAAAQSASAQSQRRRSASLPDEAAPTPPRPTAVPRSGSRSRPGSKTRPFAAAAAAASPMPQFEEQYRKMRVDDEQAEQAEQAKAEQAKAEQAKAEQTDGTPKRPIFANLSLDDSAAKKNRFMSSSVDDINTRFVPDERARAAQWEFSAGGAASPMDAGGVHTGSPRVRRSQSGTTLGRRSPGKAAAAAAGVRRADSFRDGGAAATGVPQADNFRAEAAGARADSSRSSSRSNTTTFTTAGVADGGDSTQAKTGSNFNAEKWLADQISSKHFMPATASAANAANAANTTNGGQAAPPPSPTIIDLTGDSDNDKVQEQPRHQTPPPPPPPADDPPSPVAMDIDSPPTGQPSGPAEPAPAPPPFVFGQPSGRAPTGTAGNTQDTTHDQSNEARTIPVEPSRPEWRAGTGAAGMATGIAAGAAAAATAAAAAAAAPDPAPPPKVHLGSEDSDEFRATMADLRKVEPLNEGTAGILGGVGSGLASFGDLQTNLPFESRAAAAPAPARSGSSRRKKTMSFPPEPTPPHPPPALAVPGLQPSRAAWAQYVAAFAQYMAAWGAYNNRYVDHFVARRNALEVQRREGGFRWVEIGGDEDHHHVGADAHADVDGPALYLEWMAQDEEARARWAASCTRHEQAVRQFLGFRRSMKGE